MHEYKTYFTHTSELMPVVQILFLSEILIVLLLDCAGRYNNGKATKHYQ